MIVLIESHRQERATIRPGIVPPDAGSRWGKPAQFGFDASDAEAEEERGGVVQIQRSSSPERVMVWNLSPVWRRCDVVKIVSQDDPNLTTEALVTREMLIPVGSKTQRYVGGGIGYVVDPGKYGFEERAIHTFVRLQVPTPVPDAEVVGNVVEGAWPDYPEELFAPGRFSPIAPVSGGWTR